MKKFILKLLLWIFLIIAIFSSIILALGYIKYKEAIDKISIEDKIAEIKSQKNYVEINDISDNYKNAVISIEDHRFYDHNGVDYFTIIRSLYINIRRKSADYGGSTITQQVRKINVFFSEEIIIKKSCRIICCK